MPSCCCGKVRPRSFCHKDVRRSSSCRTHGYTSPQVGGVAAAAVCAQSASATAAVAAGVTDQLYDQDPALDSLIDRWLSHKAASTSAPTAAGSYSSNGSNGNNSRRQQGRQPEQALQAEWEALLGPVTATMLSLTTLEEGDDLFALGDSLNHLGGSLQELQQLTTQLLQQQQHQQQQESQQQAIEDVGAAEPSNYTDQLAQLLLTAGQQAGALEDNALINLLAISTVLLTSIKHSSSSVSSSRTLLRTAASTDSSFNSGLVAVQAAATAAVQATCAELWQRPRVAAGLDAAQLTSLVVVLRRLSKLSSSSSSGLPVSLPTSAYLQLQQLAGSGQMSRAQLAVCCWCLSSLPVAPPPAAVSAALSAAVTAAAAAALPSSSSSAVDSLAIRKLAAACVNWRRYVSQQQLRTLDKPQEEVTGASSIAAAAAEFLQHAADAVASPSSSGASTAKAAAAVAQAAAAYGVFPGERFVAGAAARLLQQLTVKSSEQQSGAVSLSLRDQQDAAAAVGYLVPWWDSYEADVQQQLLTAVLQLDEDQAQQEAVPQQGGQQQQQPYRNTAQAFLSAVAQSCTWFAEQAEAAMLQQLHAQLSAITQQLLPTCMYSRSSSAGCTSLLFKALTACTCRPQQLLQLCASAVEQLQAQLQDTGAATSTDVAAAAADAGIALCRLQPAGWQQQLQQLVATLVQSQGTLLQQLPLSALLELYTAAAVAGNTKAAAASLAAAVLEHLLLPGTAARAQPQEAAELLVLLSVGQPPWSFAAGQQLQAMQLLGLQQLTSSSSNDEGAVGLLQQQCLRCMGILARDSGRSLLPDQLTPVLAALCYLQQQQQQEQLSLPAPPSPSQQQQHWMGPMTSQVFPAYQRLHREALAAVCLQLQDCASLLAPRNLALSARLLALLQVRPSLALGAVVASAAGCVGQLGLQDLAWMLWGLTRLQFTGEQRLQQQLLSAALQEGTAAAAAAASFDSPGGRPAVKGIAVAGEEESSVFGEGELTVSAAAADSSSAAQLDASIALLWVAARRDSKDPAVLQVLSHITQQAVTLRPAQLASLAWSVTQLAQGGMQQVLQQQEEVVELVERGLCSTTAAQQLQPRHVAVLAWGLLRLGHQPSEAAQATLVAAALQHTQLQTAGSPSGLGFLPGEFSCFLYCLASWGVQLQQQQLQQLEGYLQQQLHAAVVLPVEQPAAGDADGVGVTTAGASVSAVSAPPGTSNGPSASSGGSNSIDDSSSSSSLLWDGPAVCSACWSLVQLGATLQHDTLQTAEQLLLLQFQLQDAPAASTDTAATGLQLSTEHALAQQQQQQQQKQQVQQGSAGVSPPSASDLVLFGTACKASSYQPVQLLQGFRAWLLMQLAKQGAAGLLALQSRSPKAMQSHLRAAPFAGSTAGAAGNEQQQQSRSSRPQQAHLLVGIMLFLEQARYNEPLLLQQLESVALHRPVCVQLDGRQMALLLGSFCRLGYTPQAWFDQGLVRGLNRLVMAANRGGTPPSTSSSSSSGRVRSDNRQGEPHSLSAQDCVVLLECLAAWHKHSGVSNNTAVRQYTLPGLAQILLGVQHQRTSTTAAARSGSSAAGSSGTVGVTTSAADTASANHAGSKSNASSSRAQGVSMVPTLQGWQAVSLLRSMVQLELHHSNKLFQQLGQQLLRRLQQTWPDLDASWQVAGAHAAGRWRHDLSGMLSVQQLLPQSPQAPASTQQHEQQQQEQQPVSTPQLYSAADAGNQRWLFASASGASRLLWVFGNVGKHPGPQLVSAALTQVSTAARVAAEAGLPLPLREVSTALYAAAVLQELQHPAALALVQLLQGAAAAGQLLNHPQFTQQSKQLAACLLAALDDTTAAAGRPPGNVAAAAGDADGAQGLTTNLQNPAVDASEALGAGGSPWLSLPTAVQQRLSEAWRRGVFSKAGKKQGVGEHMQLLLSLRLLGLRGKIKALTDDGCVCIDVASTTPQGDRLAIELLGPHNAAVNTQRPLGLARLKWRLLASRGYRVVVINTWQWRALDSGGLGRGSRDGGSSSSSSGGGGGSGSPQSSGSSGVESSVEEYDGSVVSERLLYLQARLQSVLGPAAVANLSAGSRGTRPLPQPVMLSSRGGVSGVVQQQLSPGSDNNPATPATRRLFGTELGSMGS